MRTIAQCLTRRTFVFWVVVLAIFSTGALLRISTIDRGTPAIGVVAYLIMLLIFFVLLAVPAGMMSGLFARWFVRISVTPAQLRATVFALVLISVVALHHLGRASPPWHVWSSAAALTALATLRTYRWGRLLVIAWRADQSRSRHAAKATSPPMTPYVALAEQAVPIGPAGRSDRALRRYWGTQMQVFSNNLRHQSRIKNVKNA